MKGQMATVLLVRFVIWPPLEDFKITSLIRWRHACINQVSISKVDVSFKDQLAIILLVLPVTCQVEGKNYHGSAF